MADIELVIKIPEKDYKNCIEYDALTSGIRKAIQNGTPLDKIRAEIERLQKMCDKNDLNLLAQYSAFGMVLEIIDKYKAESEVQNADSN